MNTTNYAVVANENVGGMPTVVSKNSNTYWEYMNIGYATLTEGTKRYCEQYQEEMMGELININYFE